VELRHSGSFCTPKNFRSQKYAGKFLASIFWNKDGIILNDYFAKCQTINDESYSSMQVQLKDIFKLKDDGKYTKWVLFSHDYAPTSRALALQMKPAFLGFQCLDQLPYSPYLTPSGYHLIHGLNKQLKSRHFSCDAQAIAAPVTWMEEQISEIFLSGLQKIEQRTRKCIELRKRMLDVSRVWSL
jgi:hypothetical protein